MKRILIPIVTLLVMVMGIATAQKSPKMPALTLPAECKKCHTCDQPTKANPCLELCPRQSMATYHQKSGPGPDAITMANLSPNKRVYPPVMFSHKAHAEMSDLSGGCKTCHHYNLGSVIVPCRSCHDENRKRADVSKPDLKGAYHRQCMDCHKSWSGNTKCEQCHGRQKTASEIAAIKTQHPTVEEPTKVIKTTSYNAGRTVTFYHNQHTGMFGLECQTCHSNEGCVRCHDKTGRAAATTRTLEQKHSACSKCHNTKSQCGFCHTEAPQAPFDHARRTGFAMNRFHARLACTSCHKVPGRFTGLTRDCAGCHKSWAAGGFNHSHAGLTLDEIHASFECVDCHSSKDYAEKSCRKCHDDKSWPKDKPGTPVNGGPAKPSRRK